jgi:hypothetical protein
MTRMLNKREQIALYSTIAVVIFSIIFNFLIAPLFSRSQGLNSQIAYTRAKIRKYLRLLKNKERINAAYNSLSASLNLPEGKQQAIVSVLGELENFAKSSGVYITDIRPDTARVSGRGEMAVNIKAEANMQAFLKFIYSLEKSASLIRIKKLQISSRIASPLLEGSFLVTQFAITPEKS